MNFPITLTEQMPEALSELVQHRWEDIFPLLDESQQAEIAARDTTFWQQFAHVLAGSDYVASQLRRHPDWLIKITDWIDQQPIYLDDLKQRLAGVETEDELNRQLRFYRHQHMVRIIWRDLNRIAAMTETTLDLSLMADACINATLDWLVEWATPNWGLPYSPRGDLQRMIVIGMGKLGACELNLSSDIDLMFSFPENGETQGGRKCMDNQSYFNRLGQKLIQALDNTTVDGFVFRVDMRLRPYGKSGILCPSFPAMIEYYQDQGRDWERYALIKARVIAGDYARGQQLMDNLRPFVFRKYLDYSAFSSLREMKEMINREVRRRQLQDNIKLGPGGIREVEFIAQAFQLIRGGKDRRLQSRELLKILRLLPSAVSMPEGEVFQLSAAYHFLRNTEHAIQALDDQQTQELPKDELTQLRVANSMGFSEWENFTSALQEHRDKVSSSFAETIEPDNPYCELDNLNSFWLSLWDGSYDAETVEQKLSEHGYDEPAALIEQINELRESRRVVTLQAIGRDRLDKLMPLLLATASNTENATVTLGRCLALVEAVLRRSAYLLLLIENPDALRQLVYLCSVSPWIANQLVNQPILLDELLDTAKLYTLPDHASLLDELRQSLLRTPEADTEQLMNVLRYFKKAHHLRVAAAEISDTFPVDKVSDYLTAIAEVILKATLEIAWQSMTQKHGFPIKRDGSRSEPDFIIVGYGKLGGMELSYGSDLDLVFIHNAILNTETDGTKPIDSQVFFMRLGQRVFNLLNANTTAGQLYEVDMRLRPSGTKGLIVSTLEGFKNYQLNSAWTWEHQALVRARVIAGCPKMSKRFEAIRKEVLLQAGANEKLRSEVVDMRHKMRSHLGSKIVKGESVFSSNQPFQLKHDSGGIVDIEFIVQFAVLAYSHKYPELLAYTNNVRLLETIEQLELISPEDALMLREVYKALRALTHQLALQNQSNVVPGNTLIPERSEVSRVWQNWVEKTEQSLE